jgi:hypothetical protein
VRTGRFGTGQIAERDRDQVLQSSVRFDCRKNVMLDSASGVSNDQTTHSNRLRRRFRNRVVELRGESYAHNVTPTLYSPVRATHTRQLSFGARYAGNQSREQCVVTVDSLSGSYALLRFGIRVADDRLEQLVCKRA